MQNMSNEKTALGLDSNVGALLCYLPICAVSLVYSIIVIVSDKTNRTVRFHAFQSLLLTAAYVIILIAVSVVGTTLAVAAESGLLAGITSLAYFAVIGIFIVLMIVGCVKGYSGSSYKLPIIGDMAEKWA